MRSNTRSWLQFNLAAWRSRNSPRYLLVRYEQLVEQREQELRRICAFVGEDYSPAMLTPNWDPTADLPWFRRAEELVTTERLGKWREELTADQVALVEWYVGSHMQTFGYQAVGRRPPVKAVVGDLLSSACDAVSKRVRQFPAALYYLTRSSKLVSEEATRERYLKSVRTEEI